MQKNSQEGVFCKIGNVTLIVWCQAKIIDIHVLTKKNCKSGTALERSTETNW